jgi:hypothetical protein
MQDTTWDGLDPSEAARWRAQLQRTARPCGCKSGAALSLLALLAWPLAVVLAGPPRGLSGIGLAILLYLPFVIAAGLLGKLAGILVVRARHRRLRRRLDRRIELLAAGA